MKMNLKKGFTLIELLVVVAIIGILASVVLASLNTARSKGKDASVQASMSSLRAQAELGVDSTGTYIDDLCTTLATTTGGLKTLLDAAVAGGGQGMSCAQNTADGTRPASWGAAIYLPSNGTTAGSVFCVDSTGFAGIKAATALTPAIEINSTGGYLGEVVCDAA